VDVPINIYCYSVVKRVIPPAKAPTDTLLLHSPHALKWGLP
jgi:hypothetical protein